MINWISVEKELPKHDQSVLVCSGNYWNIAFYVVEEDTWYDLEGDPIVFISIEYWAEVNLPT